MIRPLFRCSHCGTYLVSTDKGKRAADPQPTGDVEIYTLGIMVCQACPVERKALFGVKA